ncbi:MAG: hypothetical protein Ta2A_10530 [Treponemataceae bacterium]|nr:MAG: hypothetical protein Ta2A_10530 [Treponemataceae bacterium]
MDETILKNFYASLELMWKGMLGLFVVCTALVLLMLVVSKICNPKKE